MSPSSIYLYGCMCIHTRDNQVLSMLLSFNCLTRTSQCPHMHQNPIEQKHGATLDRLSKPDERKMVKTKARISYQKTPNPAWLLPNRLGAFGRSQLAPPSIGENPRHVCDIRSKAIFYCLGGQWAKRGSFGALAAICSPSLPQRTVRIHKVSQCTKLTPGIVF